MTPSTIFQWPLSPSGSFQFVKSLPLKRTVNPGSDWAPCALGAAELQALRIARNTPRLSCFIDRSPLRPRCRLLSLYVLSPAELEGLPVLRREGQFRQRIIDRQRAIGDSDSPASPRLEEAAGGTRVRRLHRQRARPAPHSRQARQAPEDPVPMFYGVTLRVDRHRLPVNQREAWAFQLSLLRLKRPSH